MGNSKAFIARVKATKKGSRRTPGGTTDGLVGAVADARNRGKTGDWGGGNSSTWIGLHVLCYRVVYDGRTPDEVLGATKFHKACGRTARFVGGKTELDQGKNVANLIKEFWEDHERKLKWGAQKNVSIKPPSIWAVFSKRTLHAWVERHS